MAISAQESQDKIQFLAKESMNKIKQMEAEKDQMILSQQADIDKLQRIIGSLEDQLLSHQSRALDESQITQQSNSVKQELKYEIKQMKNLVMEKDQQMKEMQRNMK